MCYAFCEHDGRLARSPIAGFVELSHRRCLPGGDVAMASTPHAVSALQSLSMRLASGKWLSRGLFAITDQALISGSNFALGILFARWLGAAEYGVYALAFAIFLLLSLVHHALLLEPMSVFGGSIYRSKLRRYLGLLLAFSLRHHPFFCTARRNCFRLSGYGNGIAAHAGAGWRRICRASGLDFVVLPARALPGIFVGPVIRRCNPLLLRSVYCVGYSA